MVRLQDRVTIRNNGASDGAAVIVTAGHLQLTGSQPGDIQIANNPGIGVLLTDNASARVFNTSIINNGSHGMRVQALSTASLVDSSAVMRGNGGKDLSCAPNSFGHGSDAGVQKMFCGGFDKSPDPGGP
jgi:phage gp45-like